MTAWPQKPLASEVGEVCADVGEKRAQAAQLKAFGEAVALAAGRISAVSAKHPISRQRLKAAARQSESLLLAIQAQIERLEFVDQPAALWVHLKRETGLQCGDWFDGIVERSHCRFPLGQVSLGTTYSRERCCAENPTGAMLELILSGGAANKGKTTVSFTDFAQLRECLGLARHIPLGNSLPG